MKIEDKVMTWLRLCGFQKQCSECPYWVEHAFCVDVLHNDAKRIIESLRRIANI